MYISAADIIRVKSNFSFQSLKEKLDLVRRLVMQESKICDFDLDHYTQGFLELYWNFSYENGKVNIEWDEESPYFLKLKEELDNGEKEIDIFIFETDLLVDFTYEDNIQFLSLLENIKKNTQTLFNGSFQKAGFEVINYFQDWE